MSVNAEDAGDVSLRYWKAVIAALPPEKRDAAWEFYLNRFSNDRAGDTLSGLILLLEAHGIYMQNLPIAYEAELIQPMKGMITDVKLQLKHFAQEQQVFRESTRQSVEATGKFSETIARYGSEIQKKVQIAVQEINTERIGNVISRSLEKSTLEPLQNAAMKLSSGSEALENGGKAAERSVELWRKVNIGSTFVWALTTAVVLSLIFCFITQIKIRNYNQDQLATQIIRLTQNDQAYRTLQSLNIELNVLPVSQGGVIISDAYALQVVGADDARMTQENGVETGVLFVKTTHSAKRLNEAIQRLENTPAKPPRH